MLFEWEDYRIVLLDLYKRRQEKNKRYSLRAYSRDLGISSSRLSEILNGKVGMSVARASQIAGKLGLDESEKQVFLDLVESEHARSLVAKQLARKRLQERKQRVQVVQTELPKAVVVWQDLVLLECLRGIPTNQASGLLSEKLGLSTDEVEASLKRLKDEGLIAGDNQVLEVQRVYALSSRNESEQVQRILRQMIDMSIEALEKKDVHSRDVTSIIFRFAKSDWSKICDRVHDFCSQLKSEFEVADTNESVAALNVQLFQINE